MLRQVTQRFALGIFSVGHACVDLYQGAVACLVPYLVAERAYSYAAASGVVLAASVSSSFAQPAFGIVADRRPLPWLLPSSALASGIGVSLTGVVGSYGVLLALVAVGGLGIAAYHPESARVARVLSSRSHRAMGWFSFGGNIGFCLAPVLVGLTMSLGGLGWTPMLLVPAVIGMLACLVALRAAGVAEGRREASVESLITDHRSFLRLCLAVICRSIVFAGLSTFVALHVAQQTDGGLRAGAAALTVLYLGGAFGTVLGGAIAHRWSRIVVVSLAYAAAVPAVAGVVLVPGGVVYVFVAWSGVCLYVPFSLQLTLAQDYLPSRIGTASGITLGLMVSAGGLATPLVGALADATSVRTALIPLIVLPIASWALVRALPEPRAAVPERPAAYGDGGHR
jgi:FSR family fosmidomycin resistance protein-like MFS transporter